MVEKIIEEKQQKEQIYVQAYDETGAAYNLTASELEKKLAAEEWVKLQQYYLRHPELKKNNFFMKKTGDGILQRVDSLMEAAGKGGPRVFEND